MSEVQKPEIDIEYLKNTVMRHLVQNMNNAEWKKAFNLYNENNEKPLSLGCRPCYTKVVFWLLINQELWTSQA